jgi:hypothetical protein
MKAKACLRIDFTYHGIEWNKNVEAISPEDIINAPAGAGSIELSLTSECPARMEILPWFAD